MNADAFRQFYEYHFSENRKMWDQYIAPLTDDQFTQTMYYSYSSVRDQVTHLINADNAWFSELRGIQVPEDLNPMEYNDRDRLRAKWDSVEQAMREYLLALRDDMLFEKPLEGEDKDLIVWQVLLHVVNHGTDHRAQILRFLKDLGVKTESQDFIFYVYEHL